MGKPTASTQQVLYLRELVWACDSKGIEVPVEIIDLSRQTSSDSWAVSGAIDNLKMELGW